jgi:hypothetical protein
VTCTLLRYTCIFSKKIGTHVLSNTVAASPNLMFLTPFTYQNHFPQPMQYVGLGQQGESGCNLWIEILYNSLKTIVLCNYF